jgi:hypothetical protein
MIRIVLAIALTVILAGCFFSSEEEGATQTSVVQTTMTSSMPESNATVESCPITRPNRDVPPGETVSPESRYLGSDGLWTELYPNPLRPRPEDIRKDGSIKIKVPWWRGVSGRLTIVGGRLDANAPPVSAWIPTGYGRKGFQSTAITFPTSGCWEVTGSVGDASLTFVSLIVEPGADK